MYYIPLLGIGVVKMDLWTIMIISIIFYLLTDSVRQHYTKEEQS